MISGVSRRPSHHRSKLSKFRSTRAGTSLPIARPQPPSIISEAHHTTTQRIRSVVKSSRLYAAAHLGGHLGGGALGLDVAGLLALVADLLAGGGTLGAVTGEVTVLAAVVALGAVDTVTWRKSANLQDT